METRDWQGPRPVLYIKMSQEKREREEDNKIANISFIHTLQLHLKGSSDMLMGGGKEEERKRGGGGGELLTKHKYNIISINLLRSSCNEEFIVRKRLFSNFYLLFCQVQTSHLI